MSKPPMTEERANEIMKRRANKAITWANLGGILDGIAETVAALVGKSVNPLAARFADLELRLAALEGNEKNGRSIADDLCSRALSEMAKTLNKPTTK